MAGSATNIAAFEREVRKFSETLPAKFFVPFQKKIALEVLSRVVRRTPVDTGRARGNWNTAIGQVDNTVREVQSAGGSEAIAAPGSEGEAGRDAIDRGLAKLAELRPFQTVWISNNVSYIEFLDKGSSQQAPEGILAGALAEVRGIFR